MWRPSGQVAKWLSEHTVAPGHWPQALESPLEPQNLLTLFWLDLWQPSDPQNWCGCCCGIASGFVPLACKTLWQQATRLPANNSKAATATALACCRILQNVNFCLLFAFGLAVSPQSIMLMKRLSGIYLLPNGAWVRLRSAAIRDRCSSLRLSGSVIAKLISPRPVAAPALLAAFDFVFGIAFVGKKSCGEQRDIGDINPGLGHQTESTSCAL